MKSLSKFFLFLLIPCCGFATSVKFTLLDFKNRMVLDIVTSIPVNGSPLATNIHFKTKKGLIYWKENEESLGRFMKVCKLLFPKNYETIKLRLFQKESISPHVLDLELTDISVMEDYQVTIDSFDGTYHYTLHIYKPERP